MYWKLHRYCTVHIAYECHFSIWLVLCEMLCFFAPNLRPESSRTSERTRAAECGEFNLSRLWTRAGEREPANYQGAFNQGPLSHGSRSWFFIFSLSGGAHIYSEKIVLRKQGRNGKNFNLNLKACAETRKQQNVILISFSLEDLLGEKTWLHIPWRKKKIILLFIILTLQVKLPLKILYYEIVIKN